MYFLAFNCLKRYHQYCLVRLSEKRTLQLFSILSSTTSFVIFFSPSQQNRNTICPACQFLLIWKCTTTENEIDAATMYISDSCNTSCTLRFAELQAVIFTSPQQCKSLGLIDLLKKSFNLLILMDVRTPTFEILNQTFVFLVVSRF